MNAAVRARRNGHRLVGSGQIARRVRLGLAIATASACLAPTVTPASAATSAPDCKSLTFSPTFAADRTIMCFTVGPTYYMTRNGGQAWEGPRRIAATNPPLTVAFSPWFNRDHTVWVASTAAIWVSHDGAKTFATFDTLNGSPEGWGLRAFVAPADATGPARVALLAWDYGVVGTGPNGTEYIEVDGQLQKIQMLGAPDSTVLDYLVPPTASPTTLPRAVVLPFASDSDSTPVTTPISTSLQLRDCTPAYECISVHFSTPIGTFAPATFGDLEPPGSYLLAATDTGGSYHAYRTNDYGDTWTPWTSLEQLVPKPAAACGDVCEVSTLYVSAAPDAPRTMFALIENGRIDENSDPPTLRAERTPDIQLFRSDDAGAHWRRIGAAYLPGQIASPRANLPFDYSPREFKAEAGHRLYVVANYVDRLHPTHTAYFGTWCSTNDGLTWHKANC